MKTKNDTTKPETEIKQETGEGCPEATCSPLYDEDVRWVVNDMGELGVKIHEQFFFCYKGQSISYADNPTHEDGTPILVREVGKREFGETVWPLSWQVAGRSEDCYTVETVHTPGLSYGKPDNPDYKWTPLPRTLMDCEKSTIDGTSGGAYPANT